MVIANGDSLLISDIECITNGDNVSPLAPLHLSPMVTIPFCQGSFIKFFREISVEHAIKERDLTDKVRCRTSQQIRP
jgi:hypothetical protein